MRLGEAVSLEDLRFNKENGKLGLWSPVQFIEEHGAGIYFLQLYEPSKPPVLMVHGAGAVILRNGPVLSTSLTLTDFTHGYYTIHQDCG